jgi:hypothetical protein
VTHETLDQIKLAQHKLIAKKLRENPEAILALARRNLQRYIASRPAPTTYLWREWRTILEQNSVDQIIAVMTAKTQKGSELRQASPLAGSSVRTKSPEPFNVKKSELEHVISRHIS